MKNILFQHWFEMEFFFGLSLAGEWVGVCFGRQGIMK